jgi:Arc/MetJ-type ribon-helix-helix transcriptional regulator
MSKIINISLPEELVREIDKFAKGEYASRSDFIRETLVRRIKGQRVVDEWGDPAGEWKTVIDFREIDPEGVPMQDVLDAIKKLKK